MSWPKVKIADLAQHLRNGASIKQTDGASGLPITRIETIAQREVNLDKCGYADIGENEYTDYRLQNGDILISHINSEKHLGKCAIFESERKDVIHGMNLLCFRPNEKLNPKFAFYFLSSRVFLSKLPKITKKSVNQASFTVGHFKELEIPLPPLEEQKRIAAILDKADSVRRKRQQAIDLADDFLRSVFLDMFGDPISNPKGWEVKKLKEISSKIASGNTPKGGSKNYVDEGITFLRSQNVWKNKLLLDDVVYIDEKTHESMSKSSLKHKDILMTKTGRINTENSSLGRAALYLGDDGKANLNGHVYFIRLVENILHEFVVFILTTTEYRDYIRSVCVGGIDKRQLNKDHLEEFPIIYPPKEMQEQFVAKVNIARSMLEKAKSGLKESDQMFNGLSQKAFAGEL